MSIQKGLRVLLWRLASVVSAEFAYHILRCNPELLSAIGSESSSLSKHTQPLIQLESPPPQQGVMLSSLLSQPALTDLLS